ncbi:hypothetical protein JD844_029160 [Phrynosoma platyrhinos]|uniref:TNase-like domain-containing protein n=1 Tax=Phrynosoma platyrhinos TaxID=52577 RepID=A0ABQ7SIV3_PHRPL|nr:hypothetical protein JD844_029160 [Phrynosoma platyrhinos]
MRLNGPTSHSNCNAGTQRSKPYALRSTASLLSALDMCGQQSQWMIGILSEEDAGSIGILGCDDNRELHVPLNWQPCLSLLLLQRELEDSAFGEEARADVVDSVVRDIQNTQCLLNVEHAGPSCPHVTLQFADSKGDVGLGLVKEGLVMVEPRKEKQFQKVVTEYLNAQEAAKSARLNLWRYGDFRADDADEFGYSR